ncbi:MAG: hypothetical protein J6Z12_06415 [Paludibacteraceae bacterium]|nr:hypothetical protein [Paludibacteraceae bacterium]
MKKVVLFVSAAIVAVAFAACNNCCKNSENAEEAAAEGDSIEVVAEVEGDSVAVAE